MFSNNASQSNLRLPKISVGEDAFEDRVIFLGIPVVRGVVPISAKKLKFDILTGHTFTNALEGCGDIIKSEKIKLKKRKEYKRYEPLPFINEAHAFEKLKHHKIFKKVDDGAAIKEISDLCMSKIEKYHETTLVQNIGEQDFKVLDSLRRPKVAPDRGYIPKYIMDVTRKKPIHTLKLTRTEESMRQLYKKPLFMQRKRSVRGKKNLRVIQADIKYISRNKLQLDWSMEPEIEEDESIVYHVAIAMKGSCKFIPIRSNLKKPICEIGNLLADKEYVVRIRVHDKTLNKSDTTFISLSKCNENLPLPPVNLRLTREKTEAEILWDMAKDEKYPRNSIKWLVQVEQCDPDEPWKTVKIDGENRVRFHHLKRCDTVNLRVIATTKVEETILCSQGGVIEIPPFYDYKINPPRFLKGTVLGAKGIKLEWKEPEDCDPNIYYCIIARNMKYNLFHKIAETDCTSVILKNIPPGKKFEFAVYATNGVSRSENVEMFWSPSKLGDVKELRVYREGLDKLKVTWKNCLPLKEFDSKGNPVTLCIQIKLDEPMQPWQTVSDKIELNSQIYTISDIDHKKQYLVRAYHTSEIGTGSPCIVRTLRREDEIQRIKLYDRRENKVGIVWSRSLKDRESVETSFRKGSLSPVTEGSGLLEKDAQRTESKSEFETVAQFDILELTNHVMNAMVIRAGVPKPFINALLRELMMTETPENVITPALTRTLLTTPIPLEIKDQLFKYMYMNYHVANFKDILTQSNDDLLLEWCSDEMLNDYLRKWGIPETFRKEITSSIFAADTITNTEKINVLRAMVLNIGLSSEALNDIDIANTMSSLLPSGVKSAVCRTLYSSYSFSSDLESSIYEYFNESGAILIDDKYKCLDEKHLIDYQIPRDVKEVVAGKRVLRVEMPSQIKSKLAKICVRENSGCIPDRVKHELLEHARREMRHEMQWSKDESFEDVIISYLSKTNATDELQSKILKTAFKSEIIPSEILTDIIHDGIEKADLPKDHLNLLFENLMSNYKGPTKDKLLRNLVWNNGVPAKHVNEAFSDIFVKVDVSDIVKEKLVFNIIMDMESLHEVGMILLDDRIEAAGCKQIEPLTEQFMNSPDIYDFYKDDLIKFLLKSTELIDCIIRNLIETNQISEVHEKMIFEQLLAEHGMPDIFKAKVTNVIDKSDELSETYKINLIEVLLKAEKKIPQQMQKEICNDILKGMTGLQKFKILCQSIKDLDVDKETRQRLFSNFIKDFDLRDIERDIKCVMSGAININEILPGNYIAEFLEDFQKELGQIAQQDKNQADLEKYNEIFKNVQGLQRLKELCDHVNQMDVTEETKKNLLSEYIGNLNLRDDEEYRKKSDHKLKNLEGLQRFKVLCENVNQMEVDASTKQKMLGNFMSDFNLQDIEKEIKSVMSGEVDIAEVFPAESIGEFLEDFQKQVERISDIDKQEPDVIKKLHEMKERIFSISKPGKEPEKRASIAVNVRQQMKKGSIAAPFRPKTSQKAYFLADETYLKGTPADQRYGLKLHDIDEDIWHNMGKTDADNVFMSGLRPEQEYEIEVKDTRKDIEFRQTRISSFSSAADAFEALVTSKDSLPIESSRERQFEKPKPVKVSEKIVSKKTSPTSPTPSSKSKVDESVGVESFTNVLKPPSNTKVVFQNDECIRLEWDMDKCTTSKDVSTEIEVQVVDENGNTTWQKADIIAMTHCTANIKSPTLAPFGFIARLYRKAKNGEVSTRVHVCLSQIYEKVEPIERPKPKKLHIMKCNKEILEKASKMSPPELESDQFPVEKREVHEKQKFVKLQQDLGKKNKRKQLVKQFRTKTLEDIFREDDEYSISEISREEELFFPPIKKRDKKFRRKASSRPKLKVRKESAAPPVQQEVVEETSTSLSNVSKYLSDGRDVVDLEDFIKKTEKPVRARSAPSMGIRVRRKTKDKHAPEVKQVITIKDAPKVPSPYIKSEKEEPRVKQDSFTITAEEFYKDSQELLYSLLHRKMSHVCHDTHSKSSSKLSVVSHRSEGESPSTDQLRKGHLIEMLASTSSSDLTVSSLFSDYYKKHMSAEMSKRKLSTEDVLNFPICLMADCARFELPIDTRSLEKMRVEDYLVHYCRIAKVRSHMYKKVFLIFDANKDWRLTKSRTKKALQFVFRGILKEESSRHIDGLIDIDDYEYICLKHFQTLCAVSERFLIHFLKHSDSNIHIDIDYLEIADFEYLPRRIDPLKMNESLRNLLLFIHNPQHFLSKLLE